MTLFAICILRCSVVKASPHSEGQSYSECLSNAFVLFAGNFRTRATMRALTMIKGIRSSLDRGGTSAREYRSITGGNGDNCIRAKIYGRKINIHFYDTRRVASRRERCVCFWWAIVFCEPCDDKSGKRTCRESITAATRLLTLMNLCSVVNRAAHFSRK